MEYLTSLVTKPTIEILIDEVENRKRQAFKSLKGESVKLPTFYDRENVSGQIIINLNKAKKFEHTGIKIELIGTIEHIQDKKNTSKFIALTRDLEPPGALNNEVTQLPFKFTNVEKQYESYVGNNMLVRYYILVTITTKTRTHNADAEFGVINPISDEIVCSDKDKIKLEVGIDDWLHLVFEVSRNKYHLKDCIEGFVKFKKVSIRLVSMELQIIKKEITTGTGSKAETEVLTRFEIMDGAPIRNENIPIKWFLAPYDLTPTYLSINNRLTVQYYINLVLIDIEERRYFKQHEITLLRLDKPTQAAMLKKKEEKKADSDSLLNKSKTGEITNKGLD